MGPWVDGRPASDTVSVDGSSLNLELESGSQERVLDACVSDGSLLSRDGGSIHVLEDEIVSWESIRPHMYGA